MEQMGQNPEPTWDASTPSEGLACSTTVLADWPPSFYWVISLHPTLAFKGGHLLAGANCCWRNGYTWWNAVVPLCATLCCPPPLPTPTSSPPPTGVTAPPPPILRPPSSVSDPYCLLCPLNCPSEWGPNHSIQLLWLYLLMPCARWVAFSFVFAFSTSLPSCWRQDHTLS